MSVLKNNGEVQIQKEEVSQTRPSVSRSLSQNDPNEVARKYQELETRRKLERNRDYKTRARESNRRRKQDNVVAQVKVKF